jgi:AraC family transcriptional activator of tynA and feaB
MESKTFLQSAACAEDWRQWKARGSRRQRVDYWNDVICQAVLDVHMNLPKQDDSLFCGNIYSLNQVGARFVNFRSSSHAVARTSRQVDRTDNAFFMVSLQHRGRSRLSQCRQDVVLDPGDIGIIDSGLPFDLFFPETVDRRIVMMPKALLTSRIRSIENWKGPVRIKSDFVLSPIVAKLIHMLTERELPLTDAYAHRMLESVADYLADSMIGDTITAPGEDSSRRTFDDLVQYVAHHIASSDLCAMSAAVANGVSLRTLHRLFKRFGLSSFEQFVIEKRLALARQSLMSGAATSVSEAAFTTGFNDLSHFTRRFSAAYGVNPSSLLRRR